MFYYKKNIGDYYKKTGRLSMLEHGAYTLLIDACYDRERFPTLEDALDWTWSRSDAEIEAVKFVLSKFFTLEGDLYVQKRIKDELDAYHALSETNSRIAKQREEKRRQRKRNDHEACTNSEPIVNEAPPNQEPRTKNQEPLTNEPIINIGTSGKPKRVTKKQKAINALIEMGVREEFASAIIEKRKGDEFTKLAIEEVELQAKAVNLSFVQAIEFAAKQEWRSFRADWYENRMRQQNNNRGTDNFHDQFYGVGQSPFGQQQNNQMRDVGNVLEIPYEEVKF